jgi:tetratricopeptide (TPR) repeat protein
LEGAAHLAARLRRHEAAKAFAGECLAICEGLEDVRGAGRALRILSIVALGERDYEGFYDLAQRSATYARKSHDLWTLSMALNNLGYRELEEGRAEKAISLFEEALDLARARGDERSESFFLENLGLAKLGQGSIDEARDDFEASLRLAHRLRYIELIAEDLLCLAAVATTAGDFDRAARLMGGAEHLREELGVAGLDPLEELLHVRVLSALERELEPTACDEALRSGRRLDQDRLVELALAP